MTTPNGASAPALQLWCDTCEGSGTVDNTLGGDNINATAHDPCPDCDGKGYVLSTRYVAAPAAQDARPVTPNLIFQLQRFADEVDCEEVCGHTVARELRDLIAGAAPVLAAAHPQQPAAEPDMRHPKIQALIAGRARRQIALMIAEELLDDPEHEISGTDGDYWYSLHDKIVALQQRVKEQPAATVRQALSDEKPSRADLVAALRFYAERLHFNRSSPNEWATVSGEPTNWWCDEAGTATIEDGTIAKQTLSGKLTAEDIENFEEGAELPDDALGIGTDAKGAA